MISTSKYYKTIWNLNMDTFFRNGPNVPIGISCDKDNKVYIVINAFSNNSDRRNTILLETTSEHKIDSTKRLMKAFDEFHRFAPTSYNWLCNDTMSIGNICDEICLTHRLLQDLYKLHDLVNKNRMHYDLLSRTVITSDDGNLNAGMTDDMDGSIYVSSGQCHAMYREAKASKYEIPLLKALLEIKKICENDNGNSEIGTF